ncbi:MAG: dihydroxy-acid dehydratase, partial [Alphaproteobacteria bacterium]|nr:dihydroxy-acid dehydratase [Alphaproteobacteria bacterium]
LMKHTGRAVVFEDIDDLYARIDDPLLDVDASSVLVLKNCGPKGYPGFPEVGNFALPAKLLKQGVADMVRISDARMSGTAFGTIVLHITPESAIGGPLGLVRSGDRIKLDVPNRRIDMLVDDATLAQRRKEWQPPREIDDTVRGYAGLFQRSVLQADEGCDFDFLVDGPRTTHVKPR